MQTGKNRGYFYKLLVYFMCTALIPLVLLGTTMALIINNLVYSNINNSIENHYMTSFNSLDSFINDCTSLISQIRVNPSFTAAVKGNSNALKSLKNDLDYYKAGREQQIEIHIISNITSKTLTTGNVPNIYSINHFSEYGLLGRMMENPFKHSISAAGHNIFNKSIAMSIGQAITDKDCVTGFIILDIYASKIKSLLNKLPPEIKRTRYWLVDSNGVTITDSFNPTTSGILFEQSTNGTNELIRSFTNEQNKFTLHYNADISDTRSFAHTIILSIIIFTVVIFILTIIVAYNSANILYSPIKTITKSLEKVGDGNFDIKIDENHRNKEFRTVANAFNTMVSRIKRLMVEVREEQEALRIAELGELSSRIRPHFIYNMLNEIKSLAKFGRNNDIIKITVSIGKLLRHAYSNQDEFIPIREDISLIRSFLELQTIRLENAFTYEVTVDDNCLELFIPKFVLQPLVENCFAHGIADNTGGIVRISVTRQGQDVLLTVHDNGSGIDENTQKALLSGSYKNNNTDEGVLHLGTGIYNIQSRIKILDGNGYGLSISSKKGCYTTITVRLKVRNSAKKY